MTSFAFPQADSKEKARDLIEGVLHHYTNAKNTIAVDAQQARESIVAARHLKYEALQHYPILEIGGDRCHISYWQLYDWHRQLREIVIANLIWLQPCRELTVNKTACLQELLAQINEKNWYRHLRELFVEIERYAACPWQRSDPAFVHLEVLHKILAVWLNNLFSEHTDLSEEKLKGPGDSLSVLNGFLNALGSFEALAIGESIRRLHAADSDMDYLLRIYFPDYPDALLYSMSQIQENLLAEIAALGG